MKYKVGDRVQYVGRVYTFDTYQGGDEGWVEGVNVGRPKYPYEVAFKNSEGEPHVLVCAESELVLVR